MVACGNTWLEPKIEFQWWWNSAGKQLKVFRIIHFRRVYLLLFPVVEYTPHRQKMRRESKVHTICCTWITLTPNPLIRLIFYIKRNSFLFVWRFLPITFKELFEWMHRTRPLLSSSLLRKKAGCLKDWKRGCQKKEQKSNENYLVLVKEEQAQATIWYQFTDSSIYFAYILA